MNVKELELSTYRRQFPWRDRKASYSHFIRLTEEESARVYEYRNSTLVEVCSNWTGAVIGREVFADKKEADGFIAVLVAKAALGL
jgi:hypothetical protein